ncbi:MAG: hypothetical protein J1E82_00595 [Muribaculaceae bacterium]|nr:hypothetical protein [Muribaculaceae bacterium]
MKKLMTTALSLAILSTGIANAANTIVDQAEKATKGMNPSTADLLNARNLINEALQNPEFSNDARTYYVAGTIEMKLYDNGFNAQMLGAENAETDPLNLGAELMNGYNYYLQALPLDSLPDAKGKIKPKYSKNIQKAIKDHILDFYRVGEGYLQAGKAYPEAYNAFITFANQPEENLKDVKASNPMLIPYAYFNAGLNAFNAQEFDKSAEAFKNSRLTGFEGPDPYNNEIAAWYGVVRTDENRVNEAKQNIKAVAQAGYDAFGLEQPIFFTNLINAMVQDGENAQALAKVNEMISQYPDNPNLYGLLGFIYSEDNQDDLSLDAYQKAVSQQDVPAEVYKNASNKFLRVGRDKWNALDFTSSTINQDKQDIKAQYFDKSLEYANKAKKALKEGEYDPDIDNLIDSVNYIIETNF